MLRYITFLNVLILFTFSIRPLSALLLDEDQTNKTDLRILGLLPNLVSPLAIDPGIPDDFVALSPGGTLDPYDWIYWGPKDVLNAYFKDPESLNTPILRVKLSSNIAQTGPNSFSNEDSSGSILMPNKENFKDFASIKQNWGNYPILAIRVQPEDKLIFMAWVGLNDRESGQTLMFNLVYPDKSGHPDLEDRNLWKNLLAKTTQLFDKEYFKACGQDLNDGNTIVNVGGAKLKMVAEKRIRDETIQVVVIPDSPEVEFRYIDMEECQMGAKWRQGDPMVKVHGEIVLKMKNFTSIIPYITSVFVKSVEDFSIEKGDEQKFMIFQKVKEETN